MSISLTTPLALLGLLSLPVIAALHMLRSRIKVIPVSSLTLWNFLNPQLSGSAARRLPLTWLLLVDLLIAALLSLALAGPKLTLTRSIREGRHLVLILDQSISMAAGDERPSRYAAAREALLELASAGFDQDAVTVIGFSDSARTLADSRRADFDAQLASLNSSIPTGSGASLEAALALGQGSIDPQLPAEIHIFTDAAFAKPNLAGINLPIRWHLFGDSADNQAILTVQIRPLSDFKIQVFTRAANFSLNSVSRSLILNADGVDLDAVELNFAPEVTVAHTWEIIGNTARISVRLDGRDDLYLDDAAYTSWENGGRREPDPVHLALVTETPGPILKALQAALATDVQVIAPEDYLPGSPFDLVVFQGYLPARWPGGVVLVIDPPMKSDLLGSITSEQITELPFPQPDELLQDIDFTGVRWDAAWKTGGVSNTLEPIISAGALPLLLRGQVGLTDLVLLLVQISDANGTPSAFARHPAFPVLIANILQEAAGVRIPSQLTLGEGLDLPGVDRFPGLKITGPDSGSLEFGAERQPRRMDAPGPGFYELTFTNLDGVETSHTVGVNAGSLIESRILPAGWPSQVDSPPLPAGTTEQPVSLVPWLLAAVAIFLMLEAWLSWR